MIKELLLACAILCAACAVGCKNYQQDTIAYERVTPWVETAEDGQTSVIEETTSFDMSYNQEREMAELTLAVDSEYEYSPDDTRFKFSQPAADGSRGGGFYLSMTGYRTSINNESVEDHTNRDTEAITSVGENVGEAISTVIESAIDP